MLHLQHCNSSPPLVLAYSSIHKQERWIFPSVFRVSEVNQLLELKIKRRNGSLGAVEKDSEFEVDPDKAREALRKLDEEMMSLSKKPVDPPKIRAVDLKQATSRVNEEISASFLASAATILLVFTIFYNILFLAVIKPSIDGEKSVFATQTLEETSLQQLSTSPEIPIGPSFGRLN